MLQQARFILMGASRAALRPPQREGLREELFRFAGVLLHTTAEDCKLNIGVVLNRDSGSLKDGDAKAIARTIADVIRSHRHNADVKLVQSSEIKEALSQARERCSRAAVTALSPRPSFSPDPDGNNIEVGFRG